MESKYRLCGGTFFVLLLQARKQRTASRKNAMGEKDNLSDSNVLEGLIRVAIPNYVSTGGRSIKTYTSSYKSCKLSANDYIPFDKSGLISAFDRLVQTNYTQALLRMCDFVAAYIAGGAMQDWLVAAILELIESDDSIDGEEMFFVLPNGETQSKSEMGETSEIFLQAFLLGVWHFILIKRSDNKVGLDTFDAWHRKASTPHGIRKFTSDIGKSKIREMIVHYLEVQAEKAQEEDPLIENGISEFLPDKAPELTAEPLYIMTQAFVEGRVQNEYAAYFENALEKYSSMKTLLYCDQPKPFYDFYVCNDIYQYVYEKRNPHLETIHNVTSESLAQYSNFIIITGTGGLGKSMMMRHLFLDAINRYDDLHRIPIFIPLKDYSVTYEYLLEYIYEKFDSLGADKSEADFEDALAAGRYLLLFDGLDEIKTEYREHFEKCLESFADRYSNNMFVISSRPAISFIAFERFTVLHVSPFNREQALELIDKLDFRPDEPIIKAKFRDELGKSLYYSHKAFTENPLLLTIMLMTYEQFAEIPSKMHVFYREAYITLSQKHDASKGAFKRKLRTGITADRFSDYFAEFCARSYRDEKYEFTDVEFAKYYYQLLEPKKDDNRAAASDFQIDLTDSLCLMFSENGKYHFTHRSFQEYFCALYFSKQKDRTLEAIGDFFEKKKNRSYSDKTFAMLYDMIPEKVEEYIFLPFLKNLMEKCNKNDGYWTFLETMYPTIYYEEGETEETSDNDPCSFIYKFIIHLKLIFGIIGQNSFPHCDDFVTAEWVYLDEDWRNSEGDSVNGLVEALSVDWNYIEEYGEPDIVGRNYKFKVSDILAEPQKYARFIKILESENFPLLEEFRDVGRYFNELHDKQIIPGDDLFDLFQ